MYAGELNKRITIKYKAVTRDDFGGEVITWTTLTSAWAAILPMVGREYLAAQAEQADISVKIKMRVQPSVTVTPAMRVHHGSHVYEIKAVQEVALGGEELVLMCREAVEE